MPVKSKAEAAYLGIHHPEVLKKWKAEGAKTSTKGLPEHVKKLKAHMAAMGVK
jgi:hypothetical protein